LLPAAACALVVVVIAGCPQPLTQPTGPCTDASDCAAGQRCTDGACVAVTGACTSDLDCNTSARETCQGGACVATLIPNGAPCTVTADCSIDQFCNSQISQCEALHDGWCRQGSQCGAEAPVCSAASTAAPGRCVECLTSADCGVNGSCASPGICETGSSVGTSGGCPPNSTAGAGGSCTCNAGFIDDGRGGCRIQDGQGGVTDACATTGRYGDGPCDANCPQPDPDCTTVPGEERCTSPIECFQFGTGYTCTDGQCVCDQLFQITACLFSGQGFDAERCRCVTPAAAENESCVSDGVLGECQEGLTCIYSTDASNRPTFGACKTKCTTNSQCGGGRTCLLGWLTDTTGICGTVKINGQSGCDQWESGNNLCFDRNAPKGDQDALLQCVDGTCRFVCDYADNVDGTLTCPVGAGACGITRTTNDFGPIATCGG
jgi:hypothetical protein